ncbi:MAG: hypothetical protein COT38_05375 [Candidatus Omnitrophica bacterium CG08_land_8_20_14_0_20_41_16]|uniref:Membrane protein insertase YidC n=1 Tax=Candidatus Sherwoodlollariibacterium unditelluris TaxID=1974757 RepID=A0A2G9YM00_9BACT|nr:MAG: hypothetical protein COX41_01375 [Candidatus Omnitrophica bacterium CG23_combo_of_CG06-09_8_20_14_all_41_10]PIS33439.1 MAG: hypothetical protein COT38_05375 [Candidatus Omnitrophica bacterium CG08_land_8_20_14_0_20_41_16]
MEKRLILAIGLSLIVLLSWSALMPKPQPIGSQGVITKGTEPNNFGASVSVGNVSQPVKPVSENLIEYEQGNLKAAFNEQLATLKEVTFKNYNNYLFSLRYGFLLNDPTLVFKKDSMTSDSVSFIAISSDKKITKRFKFHNSNYTIELEIKVQNLSSASLKFNIPLILGFMDISARNPKARYQDITIATQDKVSHMSARKSIQRPGIKFLGLRDQYFAAIIEPKLDNTTGVINRLNNQESEIGLNVQTEIIPPNGQIGHSYRIYIGPQDLGILNNINPNWSAIIHYGTFDFISQILLQTLEFLYKIVHNWGWAIILLSLLVYLVLYPLSLKQMRSMKEMQVLQPKIEELRKANKDNPQKLNKEIMELYREHKVNPLGGCLPLILQIPVFFALYNALMRSVVLKGAKFLWIKDLSEPDRLIVLPQSIPILGNELNILPIIMAIGMFVQQKISSASASGASAEQQKIMIIVMPVIFGLIFYRMPSGLVLYWFVNSTLMLIFQLRMNRTK